MQRLGVKYFARCLVTYAHLNVDKAFSDSTGAYETEAGARKFDTASGT